MMHGHEKLYVSGRKHPTSRIQVTPQVTHRVRGVPENAPAGLLAAWRGIRERRAGVAGHRAGTAGEHGGLPYGSPIARRGPGQAPGVKDSQASLRPCYSASIGSLTREGQMSICLRRREFIAGRGGVAAGPTRREAGRSSGAVPDKT
jgi:hypothetical protein